MRFLDKEGLKTVLNNVVTKTEIGGAKPLGLISYSSTKGFGNSATKVLDVYIYPPTCTFMCNDEGIRIFVPKQLFVGQLKIRLGITIYNTSTRNYTKPTSTATGPLRGFTLSKTDSTNYTSYFIRPTSGHKIDIGACDVLCTKVFSPSSNGGGQSISTNNIEMEIGRLTSTNNINKTDYSAIDYLFTFSDSDFLTQS